MTRAVLALGSNLGSRLGHLRAAVVGLRTRVGVELRAVSTVVETPPWGDPDQSAYLNAVVIVEGEGLEAYDWLVIARELERAAGRVRDPERPNGPRTLDVDVIDVRTAEPGLEAAAGWRSIVEDGPELTLPHPRAYLRAFVLVPWSELEPDAVLPGHGPIAALLTAEPVAGEVRSVRRYATATALGGPGNDVARGSAGSLGTRGV